MGILLSQTTHEIKAHHPPPEAWIGRYLGTIRPEGGSSMRRTETVVFGLRTLLVVALVWLLVAGLLTLQLWPDLPEATLQWVLFIALGPPVYLLGERSEEHTSELQSLMRISYAVFCLKKKLISYT